MADSAEAQRVALLAVKEGGMITGERKLREYLGELYIETGDMAKAREQLAVLAKLCPSGCGSRYRTETITSLAVVPSNGTVPVSIS